jgi:PIN domain nuclease of toxin-antitoxin system
MPIDSPTPILLDTCALLWASDGKPMTKEAQAELEAADRGEVELIISPISAWEIGNLVSKGRLILEMEPRPWFQRALNSGMSLADMPPDVLIASAFLPGSDLRDPADRILAATAREYGFRLMTRDGPLLDYGLRGHMRIIRC